MPKTNINYNNTIIYKIVCNDLNILDIYIGHTTDFTRRKNNHKSICNNENNKKFNFKVYQMIRENGGWSNWSMIEIEKYPCLDGNEARLRERYWYEFLNGVLNSCVPGGIDIKEYQKKYCDTNKKTLALKNKQYQELNKDKLKNKWSEYRELNKDKIKEYKKNYYQTNKDNINEKKKKYYQEKKL
jgi:hypothetical protein